MIVGIPLDVLFLLEYPLVKKATPWKGLADGQRTVCVCWMYRTRTSEEASAACSGEAQSLEQDITRQRGGGAAWEGDGAVCKPASTSRLAPMPGRAPSPSLVLPFRWRHEERVSTTAAATLVRARWTPRPGLARTRTVPDGDFDHEGGWQTVCEGFLLCYVFRLVLALCET